MQTVLSWGVGIYLLAYALEGPLRYVLHLGGIDEFIFVRDLLIALPLTVIFVQQLMRHKIHPAYFIFIFVVAVHGTIMVLNMHSVTAVVYTAKVLMGVLAGTIALPIIFKGNHRAVRFFITLWILAVVGVLLDKFVLEFPWNGMETTIGGIDVDIGRDWQLAGDEKRVGGFMRSSIHVAMITPLLALILMYNLRSITLRISVAAISLLVLYWATQKGAIVAFALVCAVIAVSWRRPITGLRLGLLFAMMMAIVLPIVLPRYIMPQGEGGIFSFNSLYMRAGETWPQAWNWIHHHEIFPFGVGLGGLGGAMRLYAPMDLPESDNIFIFSYAYFGVLIFVYLGWFAFTVLRLKISASKEAQHAIATLMFLFCYGTVITIIEDQMGAFFLGAAVAWVASEVWHQRDNAVAIEGQTSNVT